MVYFKRAEFWHRTRRASAAQLDHGWEGEAPVHAPGVYYTHGADWGQAVDYTVIATLRCDTWPLRLVAAYRSRRRPWPAMIGVLMTEYSSFPWRSKRRRVYPKRSS